MKTTKEKILSTALVLFNKEGTDSITTRHIASALSISHGNLCYHYPRKEEIIKDLYYQLVLDLDHSVEALTNQNISIAFIYKSIRNTFNIQLKYKFILIEFVKVIRLIPEIGNHFKALYLKRQDQFLLIISLLEKEGYFKMAEFPDQYESIIKQFYIIGDFWLSEAEILFEGSDEERANHYSKLSMHFFYPYLTEKGHREFKVLFN
jgi:AcrR family transcriptional regulator